ncbi:MAG: Chemotaxis protein CheA, partial [Pseudomonadota bacterium]
HSDPAQSHWAASLMRWMHTLKGSARMAGAMQLGQAIHEMESLIERQMAAPDLAQDSTHERVLTLIADLIEGQDAASAMVDLLTGADRPGLQTEARHPVAMDPAAPKGVAPPAAEVTSPLVRVRADLLDRLVNEAGEVAIARARLDGELSGVHAALADLSDNVARLRSQLREIQLAADTRINTRRDLQTASPEFDPLEFDRYTRFQELTRLLAEAVDDVATVHHNAVRGLEQASRDLHLQAQVTRDLQQDLMTIRMVRFSSIAERLHRVVRQAGRDTGRQAKLEIAGERVELDRSVLERVLGPLEHVLRNAVAHGIELPQTRTEAGKPVQGALRLSVHAEGRSIAIELADDGRGLDLARIRERALERGLVTPEARLSDAELAQLIFLPGFTTADQVSAVAGRGVGLDVVRAEVAAMGGRIDVTSMAGQGTCFSMHLPASMALSQVMLVRIGDRRFAIGSGVIEQVLQPDPEVLNEAHARGSLDLEEGASLPLAYLGGLLDLSMDPEGQRHPPVLLLRSGNQRLALHVDEVSPVQDVVVKDVGAQLSRMPGIVGATVLGQGDIVLIIDPVQIDLAVRRSSDGRHPQTVLQPVRMALAPTVMVVDDSVTVRKVTQRLLQREGYTVMLARDGLDALQQLEDSLPDIVLLDIEMPRMNGFELLTRLREQTRLARIPVVMISSRTADKHREHAATLGVQAFLGKPYDESELLGLIARLTTS